MFFCIMNAIISFIFIINLMHQVKRLLYATILYDSLLFMQ